MNKALHFSTVIGLATAVEAQLYTVWQGYSITVKDIEFLCETILLIAITVANVISIFRKPPAK